MNPRLGELVKGARVHRALSVKTLAETVGLTPSFLYKIEEGIVRPSAEHAFDLAEALGLDPTEVLLTWLKTLLPERKATFVPMVRYAKHRTDLLNLFWEHQANLCELCMDKVTVDVKVDAEGNAQHTRTVEGLRPREGAKPITRYAFRTFVAPETDPSFDPGVKLDLLQTPEDLMYEHALEDGGKFVTHALTFPQGWVWRKRKANAFSLATRARLPLAHYMDIETGIREYAERGIHRLPLNSSTFEVNNPIEELVVRVSLPEGYDPPRVEGWAWPGRKRLWEVENPLADGVFLERKLIHECNLLELHVKRPFLNFSFALVWQPVDRSLQTALVEER